MLENKVEQRQHFAENRKKELPLDGLELTHFIESHDLGDLQNRGYHANQESYSEENHCENQLCLLLSEVRLPSSYLIKAVDKERDANHESDEAGSDLANPNPVVEVLGHIFGDGHWQCDESREADEEDQGRGAVHVENYPAAELDPFLELIVWIALELVELRNLLEAVG